MNCRDAPEFGTRYVPACLQRTGGRNADFTRPDDGGGVGLAIAGQPSAQSSAGGAHPLSLAHLWIRGEMLSMNGAFARE
jgi:hypothetical protein